MDKDTLVNITQEKMRKALKVVKDDVSTIRTGRVAPSFIEKVKISAYDGTTEMKLSEMATITADDPRTLVVTPFDPSQVVAIEKGILKSNVGLTPVVDGEIIRLTVLPLTQERREEYIKLAKAKIEGGRIMVRQIRHDAMVKVKKAFEGDELNEDEKKWLEKEIQEITNGIVEEIEMLWKMKVDELRQV